MSEVLVAFDASCGPCMRFRRAIAFFDISKRLRFVSLEEADRDGKLDSLPQAARFSSFHMILPSGEVRSGADALADLLAFLPGGKVTARITGSDTIGRRVSHAVYLAAARLHDGRWCPGPKGGPAS